MQQQDEGSEQPDDDGPLSDSAPSEQASSPVSNSGGIFDYGFEAYRTISDEEYRSLLLSGLIVFDTNVLLDLYRYHEKTRSELLDIVVRLGDRVWIPNHAMAEFWRRRSALLDDPKDVETALNDLTRYGATYTERVAQWTQRIGLPAESTSELINPIKSAFDTVANRIRELGTDATLEDAADTAKDPVITKLDSVLNGCVGGPLNLDVRRQAIQDARQRFQDKRPPGYKDAGKGDNYAGDYLIWLETLQEATRRGIDVLFVTDDRKEDWWRREKGQVRGPHPELVREMNEIADVRLFMLRPESLLYHAGKALEVKVSPESVQDVKRVSKQALGSRDIDFVPPRLYQAAIKLVSEMTKLDIGNPGTRTSAYLSSSVAQLQSALIRNDPQAIYNAVWSLLETADNFPIFGDGEPWVPSASEYDVLSAVNVVRTEAVTAWLEDVADEHLEVHPDNPEAPILAPLPSVVSEVRVRIIPGDDDGADLVEFSADLSDAQLAITRRNTRG